MKKQTGDIGFVFGEKLVSKLIGRLTFGDASHVFLIVDGSIYETEGGWGGSGKSGFVPVSKYDGKKYKIYRDSDVDKGTRKSILGICSRRAGTPYSYWDCTVNGIFFFLHPKLKGKIARALGGKHFTKCDEEVMRVMYEATKKQFYKDYEEHTPESLLGKVQRSSKFKLVESSDG